MSQGEHGIQVVLVIKKHIGMRMGAARRVGPSSLAFVLVNVYPSVIESFFKKIGVIFSQYREGLEHRLHCLFETDLLCRVLYDWDIYVVHVELFDAKHLLS